MAAEALPLVALTCYRSSVLPTGWFALAACRGLDPELFHPTRGEDPSPALAVCGRCPVTAECLAYALTQREAGIWGATSERQRRLMRRRLGLADGHVRNDRGGPRGVVR